MLKSAKLVIAIMSLIAIAAISLLAIRQSPFERSNAKRKNLVLISIDTLRADRLSGYGYARKTSPVIDTLIGESLVFDNVITPAPWTLPAHVSMFSGLYPTSHGVTNARGQRIADSTTLLAEVLKKNGYSTLATTGGGYLAKSYGFDRGFDTYLLPKDFKTKASPRHSTIEDAINVSIENLAGLNSQAPFFLFLHTYDVHCPYTPPKKFLFNFSSENAQEINTNRCGTFYNEQKIETSQAVYMSDRYDESIQAVDQALGRLFDYLRSRPDFDQTIIVITSDHGEEFLEHGRIGHRDSLHRELLFVPLIIRAAGINAQRSSEFVSLVDLFPTVLDLLGIDQLDKIDGTSLQVKLKWLNIFEKTRPFPFSELSLGKQLRSRITGKTHLIIDLETNDMLYYDLETDPLEQENLSHQKSHLAKLEKQDLLEFISDLSRIEKPAALTESEEQLKKLETLGYL